MCDLPVELVGRVRSDYAMVLHCLAADPAARAADVPAVLAALQLPGDAASGDDVVRLVLSVPADHHGLHHDDLAGHPYVLLVSGTPARFGHGGHALPFAPDAITRKMLAATKAGLLPTFLGELDDNADALAELPIADLRAVLGDEMPSELYFAYFVQNDTRTQNLFVSNRFTVRFERP